MESPPVSLVAAEIAGRVDRVHARERDIVETGAARAGLAEATAQQRPIPSLDLDNPEVRVFTHRRRATELGLTNRELGYAVSALIDGVKASEYRFEGREIDLRIVAVESVERRTHLIEQMPIAAPTGELVTIGSVADVRPVNGPTSIQHRERAITIQVTPPASVPLERALATTESNILAPPRAEGKPGGSHDARLSGAAEKLTAAWDNLKRTLVFALVLTYLPMAALGGFLGISALPTTPSGSCTGRST